MDQSRNGQECDRECVGMRGNESGNGQEREGIRGNENGVRVAMVGMGAVMGRNEKGNGQE